MYGIIDSSYSGSRGMGININKEHIMIVTNTIKVIRTSQGYIVHGTDVVISYTQLSTWLSNKSNTVTYIN